MNRRLTYIIVSFDYERNSGGISALHYLADRLLNLGVEDVYLTSTKVNSRWKSKVINKDLPFFAGESWFDRFYLCLGIIKKYVFFNTFKRKLTRLQDRLLPKLLWNYFDRDSTVVICPEVFKGVPFRAKHVVRWIMNTPGVCGGDGVYQLTDHIFQYHPWFEVDKKYEVKGLLTVIDLEYQLNTYKNHHNPSRLKGGYLVRKGSLKKHNQHPVDYVHIDPLLKKMNDEEIAILFNSLDTVISYDDMTFISVQAALCGCNSIIIPGEGERSLENLKKANRINGVAYGFEDQEWVRQTTHLLRSYFEKINEENMATIKNFNEYCKKIID